MFGFTWLDAILLLWLLWQLVYGLRAGLIVSLGGLIGFIVGAVAAFFAVPLANQFAPSPGWRLALTIGLTIVLIGAGNYLGIAAARAIGKRVKSGSIKNLNRILGGVLNVAVGALVVSILAFGVNNLGIPTISDQITRSQVISRINAWTPKPVQQAVAQLRFLVADEGIPKILNSGLGNVDVAEPSLDTDTPAWNKAAESVLKITGTAFQCGQNQTGTGFVIAPQRVMTNAHVVAGVAIPVVQTQNQGALSAKVVYFDPARDLAILAVNDLAAPVLPTSSDLSVGETAAFAGYPLGGPLQVRAAKVLTEGPLMVPHISNGQRSLQDVYQLAGNVQSGNSGGPVLDDEGNVTGVIFAKSSTDQKLGYAFTMDVVGPIIGRASALTNQVSSGSCTVK